MAAAVRLASLGTGILQDKNGNVIPGRSVNVYQRDTTTQVAVFSDEGLTSPLTQPLITDANGNVPGWVLSGQSIDFFDTISGGRIQGEPLQAVSVVTNSWIATNVIDPKYGAKGDGVTDDTAAIQAAYNAAQAKAATTGQAVLVFPSGYGFKYGQINIGAGGVDIWAYGSQHIPNNGGITNGLYATTGNTAISRFAIRGGTWAGTGSETHQIFFPYPATGTSITDIEFRDMYINNWGCGPLVMYAAQRARALNNTILNTGSSGNTNTIDFVLHNGDPQITQYLVCRGNTILNTNSAACIAVVQASSTPPSTFPLFAIIDGNVTDGIGSSLSGAIDIECDSATAAAFGRVIVVNNHCTNRLASGLAFGMTVEVEFADTIVANNTINVVSTGGYGIAAEGASSMVVNNRINANTPFYSTYNATLRSGNLVSTGPSQGRATLVAGTVTVTTAEIQAADNVLLTVVSPGGTRGEVQLGTITAGTSFVINSIQPGTASTLQTSDTSTVYWRIDH